MTHYDISEERKLIMHLDAINLYGWAMSKYLPNGRLERLSQKEIDKPDVNVISENSPIN